MTDYVITSQEYMETIKTMETDEEKQCGLYKIEHQNKQLNKTWSTNTYRLSAIKMYQGKRKW